MSPVALAAPAPVAIIGIGNVLLGDDGFGPAVIGTLASEWELPDSVELVDAGTPGLDLAGVLCGRDVVIFVDCVAATAPAGSLRFYRDRELPAALARMPRVSEHDPALAEALAISELVGGGPSRTLLIGAVPEQTEVGIGLGEAVSRAVRAAASAVIAELACEGIAVKARPVPLPSSCWWADTTLLRPVDSARAA